MRELGGAGYLAQLTGSGAALIGARDFAQQIYDLALLRELVSVGRTMVEGALDTSESIDPKGQIEQAEMALYSVAEQGGETGGTKSFAQATKVALDMAEKAQNSGGGLSGITTGLESLNSRTGGLHHSDLLILAGRPGMGKTALATNIAFNTARRYLRDQEDGIAHEKSAGAKVAFFSLAMSADQLATRILAENSGISSESLRMGKITTSEFRNLARAAAELQTLPLYIDDTPALTIAALRTRARRLKRQHKIGLVVVDYLQLLQGSGSRASDNRVQEISDISRSLKMLARELQVPVLALSQLSRASEQRGGDKLPMLSDLRDSGAIEQDADQVIFIHRPEYYQDLRKKAEDEGKSIEGIAEIILAKNRNGPTGNVELYFRRDYTRFENLSNRNGGGGGQGEDE
jgi:replicative DNA helicase